MPKFEIFVSAGALFDGAFFPVSIVNIRIILVKVMIHK